jgi:hypothetical protein
MAHNTQVKADLNAPTVTRILADFVATHPSRGWPDAVEHEARRTILNWLGCAIGASRHPTLEAGPWFTCGSIRSVCAAPSCLASRRLI